MTACSHKALNKIYSVATRYIVMKFTLRHIATVLLLFFGCFSLMAETVSQKEASRIAAKFFNAAAGEVLAKPKYVYNGKNLTTNRLFSPFYVYNHPTMGFVIISAENKSMPILAYSLKSKFNSDKLTESQQKLLKEYALDIEYIRYDSRIPDKAIEAWTNIPGAIDYSLNSYQQVDEFIRIEEEDAVWIMRKQATEFPGIAHLSQEGQNEEEEIEDAPFSFYDNFIAKTRSEEQKRLDMFEEKLHPTTPRLHWIGGGHFEAVIPQGVKMVRIYNMDGAMVRQLTFRNTDTAVFNIDSEPNGFYLALINDTNGKSYGFKLCK